MEEEGFHAALTRRMSHNQAVEERRKLFAHWRAAQRPQAAWGAHTAPSCATPAGSQQPWWQGMQWTRGPWCTTWPDLRTSAHLLRTGRQTSCPWLHVRAASCNLEHVC